MPALPLTPQYCGRFAPSPTGPLHFGSLVAAVGSYLDARSHDGAWLLRLEDVDRPRCQPGAADGILHALTAFGFEWDGAVVVQSRRDAAYQAAFEKLRASGRVFPCACTRREMDDTQLLQSLPLASDGARIYPGTCRSGLMPGRPARSWRLRVNDDVIVFEDAVQGRVEQEVTHVVRGADLLDSTPRQILLQRLLGLPTPSYAHLPVAVNAAGEKLSKQTRATQLDTTHPLPWLLDALRFLGQEPPRELSDASLAELWDWAKAHWDLAQVPHRRMLAGSE
ncbi:MAG: glutamyl-Q tRNA(Asp) synthetase [Proteobacteria bacterium]|nr:glutamyl-Q tRNA(Asp) synthetase [Pseudomonadota bacterium]